MAVYKWRTSHSAAGISAQVAGEEIERISERNNGTVTPVQLVAAAKPKRSPLHAAFEWDDAAAGEEWRRVQAGKLLGSVVIVTNEDRGDDVQEKTIRAFVHTETESAYTPIVRAMSDESLRREIVAKAWKELQEWRARHDDLSEFASVFAAMDRRKAS